MPIDYRKYPPNWKSEIVPAVLTRAGHCCEECGLPNRSFIWSVLFWVRSSEGKYAPRSIWFRVEADAVREAKGADHTLTKVKVVLTVAHLDHDETNTDIALNRLKALCQVCHLRYDAREKCQRQVKNWGNNLFKT